MCNGYFGCPCCEDDPKMEMCEECRGEGVIYLYEGEELTKEEYDLLNAEEKDTDVCSCCKGEGEVECEMEEKEYEYYDY